MVTRVRFACDGLQAPGAVYVRGRGDFLALVRAHGISQRHEGRRVRLFKIFPGGLGQDRRRKGAKALAVLDAPVENLFHFGTAGVRYDAAIPERARAPLGSSLKPAEDLAVGNDARSAAD